MTGSSTDPARGDSISRLADEHAAADAWRHCGAAAITAGGLAPEGDPAGRMNRIAADGSRWLGELGGTAALPGAELLALRERLSTRAHTPVWGQSLRGSTRFHATADGWIALNMARESDIEAIPALTLGEAHTPGPELDAWLLRHRREQVIERTRLLGLACGAVPARRGSVEDVAPFALPDGSGARPRKSIDQVAVADLTRLWAGPLAGALLAQAGAHVIRYVDIARPTPIEPSDFAFDEYLNHGKETISLDFADRDALSAGIAHADVVLTAMRPVALRRQYPRPRPGQVWIAISAYGDGANADRVGFGDECAAEAGLLVWKADTPAFAADAIGDPITGLLAAVAALAMLAERRDGRVQLDLVRSARWARHRASGS